MPLFLLDIAIGGLIIVVFAIVVTVVSHIFLQVPFVPTPWNVAKEMVDMAKLQPNQVVYDLGAGDARLLVVAKRVEPTIIAKGYELSPMIWLTGKLRLWLSGVRAHWTMRDLTTANLRDADCIMLYLIPGMMNLLEKKLNDELRPGTRVVSYAFQFAGRKAVEERTVPWLSGERQLRLYVW